MFLSNAQSSPYEAFDNWMKIEGYLRQNASSGKIPPEEIQSLFAVAESCLVKCDTGGEWYWRCSRCNSSGCRELHPKLKREYQDLENLKKLVEFIPVSDPA